MELSGWGRFPKAHCRVAPVPSMASLETAIARGQPMIARGMGRSYGDSAMNRNCVLDMRGMNRFLAFDPVTGALEAEAGVLLKDIIDCFLPRGWFPAVSPGTRFVTLGGMIAADVHGKNHHGAGSFGSFVDWIELVAPDGTITRCSRKGNSDLFALTIGGMGLTGPIVRAGIRLKRVESAWIRQTQIAAPDLDSVLGVFEETLERSYSVAWIDCLASGKHLGRSLVTLGEHAVPGDLPPESRHRPFDLPARRQLNVPLDAPGLALNRFSVKAFNALYYARGKGALGESLVGWDSYFYPLDTIQNWNRIYGAGGFVQFQCVLPLASSRQGLIELLEAIAAAGSGSFLAVLKRMGRQEGALSFPMEGYTLALDFPARRGTFALLDRLDRIVLAHGGRFYLAKDARMPAWVLRETDPRARTFREKREELGLTRHFSSLQSERLGL